MSTFRRGLIVLLAGALALFLVPGPVFAVQSPSILSKLNTRVKNCADCHIGVELTGKDIDITGYNDGTDFTADVWSIFGFHILDTEGNEVAREFSKPFLFEANSEATKHITVNDYGLADGEWKYIGWVMSGQFMAMEANMEDNQASVLLYKGLISDNDKPDTLEISKSYTGDWFASDEFGHFGGPEKTSLFSSNGTVEHKFLMKSGWAKVYIWYLENPDNGTEIPVTIMRNEVKLDKVSVNQQKNGSKMYFLGEYPFHAEDIAKVIIEADGKDNFVSSDVVFLEYTGSLDDGCDTDTDSDTIMDCNDSDDDNDGILDEEDAFPLDDSETLDTDDDGTGNNADTDDDNDGLMDTEENGPNGDDDTYDGNGDGTADNLQANAASLHSYDGQSYVTIETPSGTEIKDCQVSEPLSNAPTEVVFDYGFFEFTIEGLAVGGSATVKLYFPSGATFDTYYRFGPTPGDNIDHWYKFMDDGTTGAQLSSNIVTLNFKDGARGDDDLIENGTVVDFGGPARTVATEAGGGGGGGGGGGCFVDTLRYQ